MPGRFPHSKTPIVLDADGVRRLASVERQRQPSRIVAVLDRSAYTLDSKGVKHAYIPFPSGIMLDGHLAQRSEYGVRFDFALTLCDGDTRPVITLTGSCKKNELDQAILEVIAALTGTCQLSNSASIDLLVTSRDGLGLTELSVNPVFCLNPSWHVGFDLGLVNQANQEALEPIVAAYRSRSTVTAYTDGSLPHHGRDRGAGAMVTLQGHWASQISPKNFTRHPLMAETTGALLAMRHVPFDADLVIFTDSRALVKVVNEVATGQQSARGAHYSALDVAMERRNGKTRALWVRGHNGNCFNEAADRMAVLMARHFNAGIDPALTHSIMQTIVAEELRDLALVA